MKHWSIVRPVVAAVLASGVLLVFYFVLLSLISGWQSALVQFAEFWPWVIALAAGFGTQIGLYVRLRSLAFHADRSGQAVAVSGGASTAAMISCCTHYAANVLPILGASGLVALVAQYQTALFSAGLAFNVAGIAYVGRRVLQASRHMAQMERA